MSSFSILHWMIVLFVLIIPVGIVGLVIWLIVRASRKPAPAAVSQALTAESRLQELDRLKSQGLITDEEHVRQRSAILGGP